MPNRSLIAVDIGNSRIKLGLFTNLPSGELPVPERAISLSPDWTAEQLADWMPEACGCSEWRIASVQRTYSAKLMEFLTGRGISAHLLTAADLPLAVHVEQPDKVGVDRLVNAVAVNWLRHVMRPAVVIDLGSAMTVDLVNATGTFLGGAIAPGIGMSARALHEFTDLLPLIGMSELAEPPSPLGRVTDAAMRSGLYWGAVGAMRELIGRLGELAGGNPQVFLTGGAGPAVASLLGDAENAQFVPHLTLAGIALSERT